jgi:hypothetical protein
LIQVEIETGDALSSFKQRYNDVHGKCGFATAALLVAYDDDVRQRLRATGWHDRCTHYPLPGPSQLRKFISQKAERRQTLLYGQTENLTSSFLTPRFSFSIRTFTGPRLTISPLELQPALTASSNGFGISWVAMALWLTHPQLEPPE